MKETDPIAGVSLRNTKRHIRMKWKKTAVGEDGPQLPVYEFPAVKSPQSHLHPRRLREPECGCGYPAKPCTFLSDDTRNYCHLQGHEYA